MLALSLIITTALLLMTPYRVWVYAALAGGLFSLSLWQLIDFFALILPTAWHGLNTFLAMLCLCFVIFSLVSAYEKWQQNKHKQP